MKKTRIVLALFLALTMLCTVFAFATGAEETPTEKFYFEVESGNKVSLSVLDNGNISVSLPNGNDKTVNTAAVTLYAKMIGVAELGFSENETRQHTLTINTGFTTPDADLGTWLSKAYGFEGATVTFKVDGKTVKYVIEKVESGDVLNINFSPDSPDAASNVWKAITSHVTADTKPVDNSYVTIANGSYLTIGKEFLHFEKEGDLVLDGFDDLDSIGQTIREYVCLDELTDQSPYYDDYFKGYGVITACLKKGTTLAVSNSYATLNADYYITVSVDSEELSFSDYPDGILHSLRDTATDKKETVKKFVDIFNKFIGVVDSTDPTIKMTIDHTFDKEVATETYLKSAATCTAKAQYFYSCTCGAKGTESFESGEMLAHTYGDAEFFWAADGKTAYAKRTCTACPAICSADLSLVDGISATVTTNPTCFSKGKTKYTATATLDGDSFSDTCELTNISEIPHNYGEVVFTWAPDYSSASAKVTCLNHQYCSAVLEGVCSISSEVKEENKPTCQVMGKTTYTATVTLNEQFTNVQDSQDIQNVPVVDHKYGDVNFHWNGTSASAFIECQYPNCQKQVKAECAVTSVVKTAATCTMMGTTTYTAKVTLNGTNYTSEPNDINDIPALNHNYGDAIFTWSADGKTASAKIVCANDQTHVISSDSFSTVPSVKDAATCTAQGTTRYTAKVTLNGIERVSTKDVVDIPVLSHNYNQEVVAKAYSASAATCTAQATYYKSCTCGAKGTTTFAYGETLPHTYGSAVFVWANDGKSATASIACTAEGCTDVKNGTCDITSTVKTAPSCTDAGTTAYLATIILNGQSYFKTEEVTDISALNHSYTVYNPDGNASCTADGTKTATCARCQATHTVTDEGSALGHNYGPATITWSSDHTSATAKCVCVNDATHTLEGDCTVTSAVTTVATCTAKGKTSYKAVIELNGTTYSDIKDLTDIPATGHNYYIVLEWAVDNSYAISKKICRNCPEIAQKIRVEASEQTLTNDNPEAEGISIEGNLPEGVEMKVNKVEDEAKTAVINEIIAKNEQIVAEDVITVWDISLTDGNVDVQPGGDIIVTVPVPDELGKQGFDIYHVHTNADGTKKVTKVDYKMNRKDGTISVTVDELSAFAFIKNDEKSINWTLIIGIAAAVLVLVAGVAVVILLLQRKKYAALEKSKEFEGIDGSSADRWDILLSAIDKAADKAQQANDAADVAIEKAQKALRNAKNNISHM